MNNAAIIVAAGSGTRFDSKIPKQFLKLRNTEIIIRSLKIFDIPEVSLLVLVVNKEMVAYSKKIIEGYNFLNPIEVISGGDTRQLSVYKGLEYLNNYEIDKVIIHDAARPLYKQRDVIPFLNKIESGVGVVVVSSMNNTLYEINNNRIISVPDRKNYVNAETPQGFIFNEIFSSHKKELTRKMYYNTDDVQIFLKNGFQMVLYNISYNNLKITTKEDFLVAETLLINE